MLLVAFADAGGDLVFATADRELAEVSCCTTVLDGADRLSARLPQRLLGDGATQTLLVVQAALSSVLILGATWAARTLGRTDRLPAWRWIMLAMTSVIALPTGVLTSMEWISPRALRLPHHHCPVEAWTATPDGPWMLALFLVGTLTPIACALAAAVSGVTPAAARRVLLARVLRFGAVAAAGFVVMSGVHILGAELGL